MKVEKEKLIKQLVIVLEDNNQDKDTRDKVKIEFTKKWFPSGDFFDIWDGLIPLEAIDLMKLCILTNSIYKIKDDFRLDPEKFGLFDEIIFKKPTLQTWLGWNDKKRKFTNEKNLKKFLSWTTAIEGKEPKLTVSKNTRDLLADLVIQENKKLSDDFEKEVSKKKFLENQKMLLTKHKIYISI